MILAYLLQFWSVLEPLTCPHCWLNAQEGGGFFRAQEITFQMRICNLSVRKDLASWHAQAMNRHCFHEPSASSAASLWSLSVFGTIQEQLRNRWIKKVQKMRKSLRLQSSLLRSFQLIRSHHPGSVFQGSRDASSNLSILVMRICTLYGSTRCHLNKEHRSRLRNCKVIMYATAIGSVLFIRGAETSPSRVAPIKLVCTMPSAQIMQELGIIWFCRTCTC